MKKNESSTIEITEDVRIPGTNVILEAGDKIQIMNEAQDVSVEDAMSEVVQSGRAEASISDKDTEYAYVKGYASVSRIENAYDGVLTVGSASRDGEYISFSESDVLNVKQIGRNEYRFYIPGGYMIDVSSE